MIKRYPLLLWVFVCNISLQAQSYHAVITDTTGWCVGKDMVMVMHNPPDDRFFFNDQYFVAQGDTLLGTWTGKKVYDLGGSLAGAIYEDTAAKRLYTWSNNMGPLLACDFSLNLGDTVTLMFEIPQGIFNNGLYTVDSVGVFATLAGPRKYLRLHNPANTVLNNFGKISKLEWIESLGSSFGPMYLHYSFNAHASYMTSANCNRQNWVENLVKKSDNGVTQFLNSCFFTYFLPYDNDSCLIDYTGSVDENRNALQKLTVWPNPATSNQPVYIDLPPVMLNSSILSVIAVDATGRRTGINGRWDVNQNRLSIPAGNLTPGMYAVMVQTKSVLGVARLVISNH